MTYCTILPVSNKEKEMTDGTIHRTINDPETTLDELRQQRDALLLALENSAAALWWIAGTTSDKNSSITGFSAHGEAKKAIAKLS